MANERGKLTAFGRWVAEQQKQRLARGDRVGVIEACARATEVSRASVVRAQHKLMSTDIAIALSEYTRGAVPVDQIAKSEIGKRARAARAA